MTDGRPTVITFTPARIVIFGRDPGCDVRFDDDYMSPRHARAIQSTDGRVFIEDLGSTNGTWIIRAGRHIGVQMPVEILPGDVIRIGRTRIPWTPKQ